jgi:hypothetical protein
MQACHVTFGARAAVLLPSNIVIAFVEFRCLFTIFSNSLFQNLSLHARLPMREHYSRRRVLIKTSAAKEIC